MSDLGADNEPTDTRMEDTEEQNSPVPVVDDNDDAPSDAESDLSEVDEAEFAEFDPKTIDARPQELDEDAVKTLKAGKRKRADGEKKPKEAKRDKKKKSRRDDEDDVSAGEELEGKRIRKTKSVRIEGDRKDRERAKERRKAEEEVENEEHLSPEERRKRALDRAMDAALKNPNKRRRRKDEVVSTDRFYLESMPLMIL